MAPSVQNVKGDIFNTISETRRLDANVTFLALTTSQVQSFGTDRFGDAVIAGAA